LIVNYLLNFDSTINGNHEEGCRARGSSEREVKRDTGGRRETQEREEG